MTIVNCAITECWKCRIVQIDSPRLTCVQRNVARRAHRLTHKYAEYHQLISTDWQTVTATKVSHNRPKSLSDFAGRLPCWPAGRRVPVTTGVPTGNSTIPRPLWVHPKPIQEQAGVRPHLTKENQAVDRDGSSL